MSYSDGQVPIVGDRIENELGRQGIVTEALKDGAIVIRWDEGVVAIEYDSAREFRLIARADT